MTLSSFRYAIANTSVTPIGALSIKRCGRRRRSSSMRVPNLRRAIAKARTHPTAPDTTGAPTSSASPAPLAMSTKMSAVSTAWTKTAIAASYSMRSRSWNTTAIERNASVTYSSEATPTAIRISAREPRTASVICTRTAATAASMSLPAMTVPRIAGVADSSRDDSRTAIFDRPRSLSSAKSDAIVRTKT